MKIPISFALRGYKFVLLMLMVFLLGKQSFAQDLCSAATPITSGATCTGTAGTLVGATYTAIVGVCGPDNDVWYSFTAQTPNPTITLTTAVANPRFQVYTAASCGGAAVSMFCSAGATGTTAGLTVGASYLIRVYSTTNAIGTFNICITDPAPANDLCAAAVLLTSAASCVNTAGTVISATYTAASGATACSGADVYDVWYKFVAQTPNPTITVSSAGSGFIAPQVQVLSGTCGSFVSVGCGANTYTPAGLTIGTTYYVRVYSTTAPAATANGTFNICITDPAPSNDLCSSAVAISSAASCINTAGTLAGSTYTAIGAVCGAANNDVWYSFVAQTTNPTITLTTAVANPRFQVYTAASCGGAAVSSFCSAGASGTTAGLTIGATYLIRVYSTTNAIGVFNICVTDPAPANDLCASAVLLTSAASCINTAGTVISATYTPASGATACSGTDVYDVWYKFVAQTSNPTITVSGAGAGFIAPQVQLLSGTCGSFVSIGCAPDTYTAAGLTVGTTYYVRIYSTTAPAATANGTFNICITDPAPPNDLCSSAVAISSAATCINTAGNLVSSTYTVIAGVCGASNNDVWYSFVAQTTNPTITLTTAVANPRFQVYTAASCGGVAVSAFCSAGASGTTAGLTIGATYLIRVYSTTNAKGVFNICVTDPAPTNDLCASAVLLTSAASCVNTVGNVVNATYTPASGATACSGTDVYDVWYKFVAQTPNPTITVSSAASGFIAPQVQLLSGTCGSFVSIGCAPDTYTAAGLTIGTTYYVRIYSTSLPAATANGTFNICITDPAPVNDLCSNAVVISSASVCVNTAGNLAGSTYTVVTGACGVSGNDVWYSFIAQTTNPTIALSSTTFANPRLQLYSGTCIAPASVLCGNASIAPTGLTVGATYLVRVYSNTNAVGTFNICITDPAAPVNDNCTGAITLTSATACSNTAGTLLNSTATAAVPGDCGAVGSPEVWYQFVAQTAYPIINLSSVGAQFTSAGPRIQLLSGTCGSFTSIACVSAVSLNTALTPGGTGLTIGATYYIRIYTNSAVMSGTTWGFSICITDPIVPSLDYGKSYFNVTKGTNGGTIEPGDTLEMRANFVVKAGAVYLASFNDNLPSNTTYIPNTLRILTNEGQLYKQWTDASDGDPGTISGSAVTINLGTNATASSGGYIKNTDRPTLFGGTCMIVASYRVVVTGAYGDIISVGNGTVTYTKPDATTNVVTFPTVNAVVYKNYGICVNTVGTNAILSESGGTFGSGNAKDRIGGSGNVPTNYTFIPFTTGTPQDYYYGISNNTCPSTAPANYSITNGDPVLAHHVFNVWDIIGDHTGATNPLAGNPAADVNSGASGGYMVVINAAFRTDTAFLDTVKNLCPNTSYEYAAWFRNMCHNCSGDSTGKGPTALGYVPTAPGDSSGVHPNLTFNINGYDYYTTGDILYTGQWIKKGFTYRTGPAETQMIINIRNNAPGGGGNDWAIDDIGVATCSPTLNLTPATPTVNVCFGDGQSLSALVQSYFDNYTYYSWEKSTDGGATFTSTPYYSNGTITPTFTGSDYEYTATGPSFIGDSSTNLNIYRLRVATSAGNIADTNCSFLAVRTIQVLVNNCMYLLKADLISASAALHNNLATVQWQTVNENDQTSFEIEKSTDGSHFTLIDSVKGHATNGSGSYIYNDPKALTGPGYYRIKMIEKTGFKYSKVMLVSPFALQFAVKNLVNPFSGTISCNVIVPDDGDIRATVFDMYGRAVKTYKQTSFRGITPLKVQDLNNLSSGTYFLKVEWHNESIIQKIIKSN